MKPRHSVECRLCRGLFCAKNQQPVHQRIAVDEKLPGRGMEVLLLQQVDAQGVQQGGAVGLVVLLQAAQHKATVS